MLKLQRIAIVVGWS